MSGFNWDQGAKWDTGKIWGPAPITAVVANCPVCGNAVYCGGQQCPSSSLPLPPDGVPMIEEAFQSVQVWNYQAGQATCEGMTQGVTGMPPIGTPDIDIGVFDDSLFAFTFDDEENPGFDTRTTRTPGFITQVA